MAFHNSFRLHIAARVALLGVLLFGLLWSLLRTGWDAVPVVCAALLLLLVAELVRYVESGTRDLAALLRSVAAGDFTATVAPRSRRPPFADYQRASEVLMRTYQRLHLRRAASDELLRALIDHVGVGVLCFAANGRIAFANREARDMLGLAEGGGTLVSLAIADPRLPERLLALRDDERTQVELPLQQATATLLLHARRFTLLDEAFTVIVCHDIREELESRDVMAWRKLTRVLTHEMMNTLTPIVTLSAHLRDTLQGGAVAGDARESVEVIHERSSGLARFVEAYRQFSHPPLPVPADAAAALLLERVTRLKKPELDAAGIALEVANEVPDARFHADERQLEQVLLNLIGNAQHALAGQHGARIELRSTRDSQDRVLIHVTDNGPGIAPELLDRIFVPFYTTRAGGTGIGLALSRQLMQLNRGTISVAARPGRCRFTLRLPSATSLQ